MNVALVGTGYIADRHAEALTALGAEIVGHVGRAGAGPAAARWGGRAYSSVADLLSSEEVAAAWICVPPAAHGDIELALIDHGVPFYVEKPIGADLETPRRIAAALAGGPMACVGYYWRTMEVIPELRRMLAETPPRLVRAAWHGPLPTVPWWRVEAQSGGQMVEQATHLFDLARFLLGELEVRHATADHHGQPGCPDLDVATASTATLRFDNGAAVFTATCVLSATFDAEIEFHCDGRKLTLNRTVLRRQDADGTHETPIGRDPLLLADERFLAAVADDDPSRLVCDYHDALRTQELCCRVREVARDPARR